MRAGRGAVTLTCGAGSQAASPGRRHAQGARPPAGLARLVLGVKVAPACQLLQLLLSEVGNVVMQVVLKPAGPGGGTAVAAVIYVPATLPSRAAASTLPGRRTMLADRAGAVCRPGDSLASHEGAGGVAGGKDAVAALGPCAAAKQRHACVPTAGILAAAVVDRACLSLNAEKQARRGLGGHHRNSRGCTPQRHK